MRQQRSQQRANDSRLLVRIKLEDFTIFDGVEINNNFEDGGGSFILGQNAFLDQFRLIIIVGYDLTLESLPAHVQLFFGIV